MAGQPEYRFRHVLVRDVCYQRLPRTERVARHERTADWLDALSAQPRHRPGRGARPPPLRGPRDRPHARRRRRPVRRAGPATRCTGRPAGRTRCTPSTPRPATSSARPGAGRRRRDPADRLQLELLAHRDRVLPRPRPASSPAAAPTSCAALADRLLRGAATRRRAARAWTLLGQAAWLRADRPAALSCLDRAVELFDELPDTPEKADAYAELGRLHMLNYERDPAIAAAGAAAEIAERLGLVETADQRPDHHRRWPATRPATGAGWPSCTRSPSSAAPSGCSRCAGPSQNLGVRAAARRATGSAPTSCSPRRAVGRARADTRSPPATPRDGDAAPTSPATSTRCWPPPTRSSTRPSGRWDIQVRGLRAWLRVLRDEPVPALDDADDVDGRAGDRAARSGFYRLRWTTLGLGRAVPRAAGPPDEAGGAARRAGRRRGRPCRRWPAASGSPPPRTPRR